MARLRGAAVTEALFDIGEPVTEPTEKLTADRRRTLHQRALIDVGVHPITRRQMHPDPERTCGNCRFRSTGSPLNGRSYPKCLWPNPEGRQYPRATRGAATDVRAWWPGCTDHEASA